jgi:hypothetical protein
MKTGQLLTIYDWQAAASEAGWFISSLVGLSLYYTVDDQRVGGGILRLQSKSELALHCGG